MILIWFGGAIGWVVAMVLIDVLVVGSWCFAGLDGHFGCWALGCLGLVRCLCC